jgi:3-hydroxyisobutyrate dehydrogenase
MGAGMTRSMLRAGHDVRVWNRTAARAQPLADDGATVAGTVAGAVEGADVVLVMLWDTPAVLDVLGAGSAAAPDAVWLQGSTIGPDGMREVAAARPDLRLVDAPVLGTRGPAEQGTLVALLSGAPADVAAAQPAVDGYSARSVYAGERLGAASALKLVCNAWVATMNAAVGQSIALAEGLGLDPALFLDSMLGGASDAPYLHMKAELIAKGEFPPSFALEGALKDVELIRAAARGVSVADDVLAGLVAAYGRAVGAGHGEEDMAAVYWAFPPG